MQESVKRILSSIILLPIAFFFVISGPAYFLFFLGVFIIINSYEWIRMSKNNKYLIPGLIFLFFSAYITYLFRFDENLGLNIFIFSILISITTDIGGYVFGNIFKGPKLTKISPQKTYSGMIGSFLLSALLTFIYSSQYEINNWNNTKLLFVVLLISAISQIGDLILSLFKRLSKIKNTGELIPGHGGLLDRVDGIIFALPCSYMFFKFI